LATGREWLGCLSVETINPCHPTLGRTSFTRMMTRECVCVCVCVSVCVCAHLPSPYGVFIFGRTVCRTEFDVLACVMTGPSAAHDFPEYNHVSSSCSSVL
jgi:hypothetical protein